MKHPISRLSRAAARAALWAVVLSTPTALAESGAEPSVSAPQAAEADASVAPELDSAREHFRRGVSFYNDGDAKLALVEFRRAYEISKNYRILYNIGQVHAELEQHAKSLTALAAYLDEGGDEIPGERRAAVEHDLESLERKVARLEVCVDVDGAEIWVDGELKGTARPSLRVLVDAGEHRVEARRAGHTPQLGHVTLVAGDRTRLQLTLPRERPILVVRREPARETPAPRPRRRTYIGWIATGVLAAGAAGTGAAAALRASELAELRSSPESSASDRDRIADQTRILAGTSDALTAAAVLAGATTLVLTLRHRPREQQALRLGVAPNALLLSGQLP